MAKSQRSTELQAPFAGRPASGPNLRHASTQIVLALILIAAVFATEFPALPGPFQWDDLPHISQNPTLAAPDALWQTWTNPRSNMQYYPLSITAFWLEYQCFGLDNTTGFHVVNILLHALNAILVWQILKKLRLPWPWLAALCFAVHPLMVDSVAYISELKNLLSGAFCLLCVLAWLRWRDDPARLGFYLLACVCFAAAMLCKSVVATLPVALLAVEYWRTGRFARRTVLAALPLCAVALVLGLLFARMERVHVGASGAQFEFSAPDRVLIAGHAIVFYVAQLLLPVGLVTIYPRWHIDAANPGQYLYPLEVLAGLVALFLLRHRLGRGPLAAACAFIILLAPALGFINFYPMLYSFVADHYCYLAAIPFFALLIAIMHALAGVLTRFAHVQVVLAILLAALLAPPAYLQAARWRSETALWEPTVAANPDSWAARENLAYGYLNENRPADARDQAEASLALNNRNPRAHFTLGTALLHLRDPAGALAHFQAGLELEPSNIAAAWNYATALEQTGNLPLAEQEYRRIIELDPRQARAWSNLGQLLARRGDWAGAEQAAGAAAGIDPGYGFGRVNYGIILARAGKYPQAIRELEAGIELMPENPRIRLELARALAAAGDASAALNQYDLILREAPDLPGAQAERDRLLAQMAATKP